MLLYKQKNHLPIILRAWNVVVNTKKTMEYEHSSTYVQHVNYYR